VSNCSGCPNAGKCSPDQQSGLDAATGRCSPMQPGCGVENNEYNQIGRVIAVMSGKGGVGKSTVTALLSRALTRKGYRVGVLDADITGPSMPRLMGVAGGKVDQGMFGLVPPEDRHGIPVMSLNLLLESEDQPVIWRGPVITSVIKQFWKDVFWGKLDFLLIDLPPGTGDAALTALQNLPVNGVVLVSIADEMAVMIVKKALHMAEKMDIPVLGYVQNMTYAPCPGCGGRVPLFDDEGARRAMADSGLKLLAELPFIRGLEAGNPETDAAMDACAEAIAGMEL
jgi:Mrp family chromosome partitioning ATPase